MLMVKRPKYRKQQRGRMKGKSGRALKVNFGEYGMFAKECGIITDRQIEAARVAISRKVKRGGKIFMRIFPTIPWTKKPAETRMGKGKGNPERWICKIKPGRVLFEVAGVTKEVAKSALMNGAHKLSFKVQFIERDLL